jgi:hypothetical protein
VGEVSCRNNFNGCLLHVGLQVRQIRNVRSPRLGDNMQLNIICHRLTFQSLLPTIPAWPTVVRCSRT